MGSARRPFALALAALFATFGATLAGGCGSSDQTTRSATNEPGAPAAPVGARARSCGRAMAIVGQARAVGVGCAESREIVAAWTRKQACAARPGSSRSACAVSGYRCQATATQRGLAVDCARLGRSISFQVEKR